MEVIVWEGTVDPLLGHQHQVRSVRLGDALTNIPERGHHKGEQRFAKRGSSSLVLGDGAVGQEILVTACHLEEVLVLKLFHHILLHLLGAVVGIVPDGFVDRFPDHLVGAKA